jgi:hypothetical protein
MENEIKTTWFSCEGIEKGFETVKTDTFVTAKLAIFF